MSAAVSSTFRRSENNLHSVLANTIVKPLIDSLTNREKWVDLQAVQGSETATLSLKGKKEERAKMIQLINYRENFSARIPVGNRKKGDPAGTSRPETCPPEPVNTSNVKNYKNTGLNT